MSKIELAAGTYRLKRTVTNPHPDRRKRYDWRAEPTFEAGDEFLVELDSYDDENVSVSWPVIRRVDSRWTHQKIREWRDGGRETDLFRALVAEFEKIDETDDAFFARLDVPVGFGRWLVESRTMTRDEFERLYNLYLYGDS